MPGSTCFPSRIHDLLMLSAIMVDGPWTMVHGPWSMEHGSWSMAHGPWSMVHGPWTMDHDPWTMVHGPSTIMAEGIRKSWILEGKQVLPGMQQNSIFFKLDFAIVFVEVPRARLLVFEKSR